MLSQAGRTITTSLDPVNQEHAQESIVANMKQAYVNGANNRSMLHVDSANGDVLAYV
jgi:membrane peptidoglycan carboxypeptidase